MMAPLAQPTDNTLHFNKDAFENPILDILQEAQIGNEVFGVESAKGLTTIADLVRQYLAQGNQPEAEESKVQLPYTVQKLLVWLHRQNGGGEMTVFSDLSPEDISAILSDEKYIILLNELFCDLNDYDGSFYTVKDVSLAA